MTFRAPVRTETLSYPSLAANNVLERNPSPARGKSSIDAAKRRRSNGLQRFPMANTDAKYTPLEHEGLQVVPQDDLREKRMPFDSPRPLDHETAPKYPVPGTGPAYDGSDAPESFAPYHDVSPSDRHGGAAAAGVGAGVGANGAPNKEDYRTLEAARATPPEKKRYCGMRKGLFIGVIIAVLIIVIGAVLGGVLGTQLGGSNDDR